MESFPSCLLIAVVFNFLDFFLSDIRLWIKETKQKKSEFYLNTFVSVMNVPVGSQCLPQDTRWSLKKKMEKSRFWSHFMVPLPFLSHKILSVSSKSLTRIRFADSDRDRHRNHWSLGELFTMQKPESVLLTIPHTPHMKWYLKSKISRS